MMCEFCYQLAWDVLELAIGHKIKRTELQWDRHGEAIYDLLHRKKVCSS